MGLRVAIRRLNDDQEKSPIVCVEGALNSATQGENTMSLLRSACCSTLTLALFGLAVAPRVLAQDNPAKSQPQLSPLPKIEYLEQAATSVHMTPEKCEATASAYGSSPTSELVASISDDRLHELNLSAFACMQLGGASVGYGYTLKTVVDSAYFVHGMTAALENQQKETVKVAGDMLEKVVNQNNELVDKYNELVGRYNSLLVKAKATYAIAVQALSSAGNSQPGFPSTVYVQQSPLHCTAQRVGNLTFTNCF